MHDSKSLSREIAAELGDWRVDESEQYADHRSTYLVHQSGARLSLAPAWNKPDRLEIAGTYPQGTHNVARFERYEIGVTATRGATTIAKEIRRRLLPAYLAEHRRVLDALHAHDDDRQAATAAARTLASLLRTERISEPRDGSTRANASCYRDGLYGGFTVTARNNVDMELHGLTTEQAEAIARLVTD